MLIMLGAVLLGFSLPTYAYLDPGSGSVLLQGLLAGFAGVGMIIKLYWQRLKQGWRKLLRRNPSEVAPEPAQAVNTESEPKHD